MANCFYVMAIMWYRPLCTSLLSLIVAMEPGKRHALRPHMPEAATD